MQNKKKYPAFSDTFNIFIKKTITFSKKITITQPAEP